MIAGMRGRAEEVVREDTDGSIGVDLWSELLAGRWCVVDRFESAGRTFLIARAATKEEARTALADLDKRLLFMRAHGVALKVIAAECNCSIATVSRRLDRAMRILGLATLADLACLASTTRVPP